MRRLVLPIRRRYGAGPAHLAAHLLALAIAAIAAWRIFTSGGVAGLLTLYVGIVVTHDLLFVPLYAGIDRCVQVTLARLPRRRPPVPLINHVRAPAVISGVLLVVYAPVILGRDDAGHVALTGQDLSRYAGNWLLITTILFAGSVAVFGLRWAWACMRH